MADFYQEMAQMAEEMLAPTSQGGLGQGKVELIRKTVVRDELEPWQLPTETVQRETLRAAVSIIQSRFSSSAGYMGETMILEGDLQVVAAVPKQLDWIPGGQNSATLYVQLDDGLEIPVVQVSTIPEAGTPVAIIFVARGPKRNS